MIKPKKEIQPWLIANKKLSGVSWIEFDEKNTPLGAVGFIYEIIAIDGLHKGKRYIGKKNLYSTTTRKIPKKEQLLQVGLGRKRLKEKIVKDSDWRNYCGSNTELKALFKANHEHFERHILFFCDTAKRLTFFEAKELFNREVLEKEGYWNGNILNKFFKSAKGII